MALPHYLAWCHLSSQQQWVFEQLLHPFEHLHNILQRSISKRKKKSVSRQGFCFRHDINVHFGLIPPVSDCCLRTHQFVRVEWRNSWQLEFLTACTNGPCPHIAFPFRVPASLFNCSHEEECMWQHVAVYSISASPSASVWKYLNFWQKGVDVVTVASHRGNQANGGDACSAHVCLSWTLSDRLITETGKPIRGWTLNYAFITMWVVALLCNQTSVNSVYQGNLNQNGHVAFSFPFKRFITALTSTLLHFSVGTKSMWTQALRCSLLHPHCYHDSLDWGSNTQHIFGSEMKMIFINFILYINRSENLQQR